MKLQRVIALVLALSCSPVAAQVNPGTTPLSIAKGGTGGATASVAFLNLVQPPTASTLGGVKSLTCSSSNWFSTLSTAGVFGCTQPNFTDLAGSLAIGQIPANLITNAKLATMPANTVKGNATGGTATPTDVAPAAARSSSLLNVESFTGVGNTTYSILATDRTVGTNAAFTASRTWTLPAANAVNPGQEIIVADYQGTVTGTNTLVITRAGSDTINGTTAVTISAANGGLLLRSDGISKWTSQAFTAGTGITSVTCGTGLSGGTITTSGTCAVSLTNLTNSLLADVPITVAGTYVDGPSVAQGTTGTWLAIGQVTLTIATNTDNARCKLWDGTTVVASGGVAGGTTVNGGYQIALSGIFTTPAANIKISCTDPNNTTSIISFNRSGNSKDGTINVVRIQ